MVRKSRILSIDFMKGLLALLMLLAHVISFFVDEDILMSNFIIFSAGNLAFPGFLFCFGYAFYVAYLSKEIKCVYKNILMTTFKILVAYYISGICFELFVAERATSFNTIINVLILNSIPGWSEFLIAFSLISIMSLVFYIPIKIILNKKVVFFVVLFILLATTYFPYSIIKINQIGLLVGTFQFSCFPILQYAPFYLLGMYFAKYKINWKKTILYVSAIFSSPLIVVVAMGDKLPRRFPPTLIWILSPCLFLYLLYILSDYITTKMSGLIIDEILLIGKNTLLYILLSNIFIFSLSTLDIANISLLFGIILTSIIISAIRYILFIIRKDSVKISLKSAYSQSCFLFFLS